MKLVNRVSFLGACAAAVLATTVGCSERSVARSSNGGKSEQPEFVGRGSCATCHELESQLWSGSHHDLAMQEVTSDTVLGDFDNAVHEHFGVRTTFSTRDGRYFIETDGPDGALTEFEVAYVFGVTPLQQYLIELEDGHLQALSVAWDSRPADEGGQRWYHLYPDESIPAGDILHWSGPNQNWNYMCASCHSTHLERNYDVTKNAYDTTWFELDVSCEACHGPGSKHVEWATGGKKAADPMMGLSALLKDPNDGKWEIDFVSGNATRSAPRGSRTQVETCARCHSRRSEIVESSVDGSSFHDSYRLALLDEGLYFADGQIQDEVYVFGSFLQSKMHAKGVTCSDCHEPHTAQPLFPGNQLCARCHLPAKYDAPTHHHHLEGSAGAQCVECHMPARTYMGVDPRRDHSLRVPRPDLSVALGTPNACSGCHDDQTADWSATHIAEWFPDSQARGAHYATAFHAARTGAEDAEAHLVRWIVDPEAPGIVRATAVSLLVPYLTAASFPAVQRALGDPDPLVRAAAVRALDVLPIAQRVQLAMPLIEDPVRFVRVEAGRVLAPIAGRQELGVYGEMLESALAEHTAGELTNAERPSSHLNLGLVMLDRDQIRGAEAAFRTALRIDPAFVPGYVNLADLFRREGREEDAERALRDALAADPNSAPVHHALGLLFARTDRLDQAIEALGQAAGLAPDDARYAFVHAIALNDTGDTPRALVALEAARQRHPRDRQILGALATIHRDGGSKAEALRFARELVALDPTEPGAQELLKSLEGE